MRVLTIRRDYAEQIIDGIKKIENRSWGKRVCGQVAIHAGGKGGAIIGIVEIEDVVDTKTAAKIFLPFLVRCAFLLFQEVRTV